MPDGDHDKTLALAGIFQSVNLVHGLARNGQLDEAEMTTCIESIFVTDPESVTAVYGSIVSLRHGLQAICNHFTTQSQREKRDFEVVRYVLACMQLSHKLARRSRVLGQIGAGIARASGQAEQFSSCHDNVLANLADIYTQTISPMTPRIMIKGQPEFLTNPRNVNRIRALLLAAIRSAILWRQCGGRRREFFYRRQRMVERANILLEQLADL